MLRDASRSKSWDRGGLIIFIQFFFLGRKKISSTVLGKIEITVKMDRFHIREIIYTWKSTIIMAIFQKNDI